MFAFLHGIGLQSALRDINHHKPRFEEPLLNDDYSGVRSYIIELEDAPPVMCSGTYAPEIDFDGRRLQDMADVSVIPNMLSVTSFYGGEAGQVIFTWLPEDDPVCIPLIESLERVCNEDLSSRLVVYLFETFENVHISPTWWSSIGTQTQTALLHRMMGDMGVPFGRPAYKKRECKVQPWKILKRYRVGC